MEPFEAAPPRGFRLNHKVYVKTVRHLDDMAMYLPTIRDGVAFVYYCNEGETAETAIDRLCDRLGGAAHAEPSLITGTGTKTQRRGSHGTWSSSIVFYGKLETAHTSSRTCAAPLVCPNMPEDLRLAPYTMPDDDADDALLTAAIERAKLERSPAYKAKQQTCSFYRAKAASPCPFVHQNYAQLGTTTPNPFTGTLRLRPLHSGQWFFGCTAYENEHGHRFVLVPPSVNLEMLSNLIENPGVANSPSDPPATCLYMESRWARHHTCPLEPELGVRLLPCGSISDGSCPVRVTV